MTQLNLFDHYAASAFSALYVLDQFEATRDDRPPLAWRELAHAANLAAQEIMCMRPKIEAEEAKMDDIQDPSECEPVCVERMEALGFERYHTGGNNWAWRLERVIGDRRISVYVSYDGALPIAADDDVCVWAMLVDDDEEETEVGKADASGVFVLEEERPGFEVLDGSMDDAVDFVTANLDQWLALIVESL